MLNEERISKGLPALGFVNPRLYGMPTSAFVDVVDGNTGVMPVDCSVNVSEWYRQGI